MTGYKIIKRGRKGWITPLPNFTLSKILEHQLSYKKQGAEFMPRPEWGIVKLYSVKTGSFPWGLLDKVLYVLKGHDIKIIRQKTEIHVEPKSVVFKQNSIRILHLSDVCDFFIIATGGVQNLLGLNESFCHIRSLLPYCPEALHSFLAFSRFI